MEMVGGLDLHRSQITFRTVDLRTGELQRGKIYPGAREAVREWLDQFQSGTDAHFALEGTTGWRFVVEEIERRGFTAHLADPAELSERRGPKRRAKTDHADCELMVNLLLEGRLPQSWIPPAHILELRTLVRSRKTLVDQRIEWQQRLQAQLFHQGGCARSSALQSRGSPTPRGRGGLGLWPADDRDRAHHAGPLRHPAQPPQRPAHRPRQGTAGVPSPPA